MTRLPGFGSVGLAAERLRAWNRVAHGVAPCWPWVVRRKRAHCATRCKQSALGDEPFSKRIAGTPGAVHARHGSPPRSTCAALVRSPRSCSHRCRPCRKACRLVRLCSA